MNLQSRVISSCSDGAQGLTISMVLPNAIPGAMEFGIMTSGHWLTPGVL